MSQTKLMETKSVTIFLWGSTRQKPFLGITLISKFELLELKGSPAWNDGLMLLTEAKLLLLFIYF